MKKNLVIILAGGSGKRMETGIPKQFLKVGGKLIIEHVIEKFENHNRIHGIFVVTYPEYFNKTKDIVKKNNYKKIKKILKGGKTRQESSRIGVEWIKEYYENILIHDAVRPCVSDELIDKILSRLEDYRVVNMAVKVKDTIVVLDKGKFVKEIPSRSYYRNVQTPQGFKSDIIKKAHNLAKRRNIKVTDDCSMIHKLGLEEIYVEKGSPYNIKITYPSDVIKVKKILELFQSKIKLVEENKIAEKLKGKIIVVFGGGRGIGEKIVEKARNYGAFTYSFSLSSGIDVRDYGDCKKALEKVFKDRKRIDSVIITASILDLAPVKDIKIDSIDSQIKTNLVGNIYAAKASIEYLKASKGKIILFGSSAYERGRAGYSIYSASKAGIVNFSQGLADELSNYGIKVNIINPNKTKTSMRLKNFGNKDLEKLLNPDFVALYTLNVLTKNFTGRVININKKDENRWINKKNNL